MRAYVINVLVGIDQLANAILGGDPMETISFRAALAREDGAQWGCVMCKFLNLFQRDHCDRTVFSTDQRVLMWPLEPRMKKPS